MRWLDATLYEAAESGRDKTGKPTAEPRMRGRAMVRETARVPSRDSTEGNQFDAVERTYFSRNPIGDFDGVRWIEVSGVRYSVMHVAMVGKDTAIVARKCKP